MLPSSGLGKALAYATNHWIGLTQYLEDRRLKKDTYRTENVNRPIVISSKNGLFSTNLNGAKANGHEPYAYLRTVFEAPPTMHDQAADSGRTIDLGTPWQTAATRAKIVIEQ